MSKLTVSTRTITTRRALRQLGVDLAEDARVASGESAARIHQRAVDLAPKRKFFMAEHLNVYPPASAGDATWEVGYKESDFIAAGLPFYPPYVELGTSRMAAQPHLLPAFEEERSRFAREVEQTVRRRTGRRAGR